MTKVAARRSGRPNAEGAARLNGLILATACDLFVTHGFAGTSMEQVAADAGAGKQTIYRRYPTKESLFAAVVIELSRVLREGDEGAEERPLDPLADLKLVCWHALEFLVQPRTVAIHRIFVAEGLRFPNLFSTVWKAAIKPAHDRCLRLLSQARECGQIRADIELDAALAALLGATRLYFIHRCLISGDPPISAAERQRYFETGWTIFVRGVTPF